MIVKHVKTKKDYKDFYSITKEIYKDNIYYRSTEDDIIHLLIEGPSSFHNHASVIPYLLLEGDKVVGRFALIWDKKLSNYVQVSFFEAFPQLPKVDRVILNQARADFPQCKQIVIGLNGHLNYGAGILLSKFDEAPIFGLPYSPDYYKDYFRGFSIRTMVSYRFLLEPFVEYYDSMSGKTDFKGITVRKMNKKKLRQEIEIYTYLNNACFARHPFWADRYAEEDFELFHPFRFLIKEENLLFAELNGKPIGFFLWYPDFNQLTVSNQRLGLHHVLRYHLANPIDTFRFTETAVLSKYSYSHAVQAMILHAIPYMKKAGYTYGEGGFIFEENRGSIAMTKRFIERATGKKVEPYRKYAVFESEL